MCESLKLETQRSLYKEHCDIFAATCVFEELGVTVPTVGKESRDGTISARAESFSGSFSCGNMHT
jgi:hypothetical protein